MTHTKPMTILVTRPDPGGEELCQLIDSTGDRALSFPTIAFTKTSNLSAYQFGISTLASQDWLIFTSVQAVVASIVDLKKLFVSVQANKKPLIAAIGGGTGKALQAHEIPIDFMPADEYSSEGLLNSAPFKAVSHKKIAIMKGEGGRTLLTEMLRERGAQVTVIEAYRRILPQPENLTEVMNHFENQYIDLIICTSFEAVNNLHLLVTQEKKCNAITWSRVVKIPLLVMSERIKNLAQGLGFRTILVTPKASNEAILATVHAHMR